METILIVDDEQRIRRLYTQFFSREGFNVIAVSNAADANDTLLRERVDIMLLDINMPEVDGGILHDVANLFHKKVQVIVCSVYSIDDQKEIIKGAAGYYDKSQGLRELLKKVKAALGNQRRKKILIIDDEPEMRDLFSRLLNGAGYCPIAIEGAARALAYLEEHQKDIDLIILDINMPELDGMDFFDMLKDNQSQVKVIVSSVYPIDDQKVCIFDADDYYDKSDGNATLLEKIDKLFLSERALSDGS